MAKSSSSLAFFCTVCMENRPNNEAVMANEHCCITDHPDLLFCKRCTRNYLEIAVCTLKHASIKCMSVECDNNFDALRCRDLKLVSPNLFRQWCDLLCESSVLGYERCYCPNLACNELIIIDDDDCPVKQFTIQPPLTSAAPRRIECPNCKIEFCFRCFSAWNEEEDHRCSLNQNDAIIVVEREKWVQCPGCKNYVQRTKGCHQITCRCNTVFCYKCGKHAQQFHYCKRVGKVRVFVMMLLCALAVLTSFGVTCALIWRFGGFRTLRF